VKRRRCCARGRRGEDEEEVNAELREKRRRRKTKGPGKSLSWNHANKYIIDVRVEERIYWFKVNYPETGIQGSRKRTRKFELRKSEAT